MYFIIVEMRKVADMKKFILLIIAVVIVVGGFYFDVQETHERPRHLAAAKHRRLSVVLRREKPLGRGPMDATRRADEHHPD